MNSSGAARVVIGRHGVNLRALLATDRELCAYEECSAEEPAAARELLSRMRALTPAGATVMALFSPTSQRTHWVEGSRTQRPDAFAAATRGETPSTAPHDERYAVVDAASLGPVQAGRPAVALNAAVAELEPFTDWLAAGRFEPAELFCSTTATAAAVTSMLRAESSAARIALWDPCGASGAVWLVSSAGVEAVVPCPVAWSHVVEAVQRVLNLRASSAVTKLLFNDLFDFSDVAPRVAESLAAPLRQSLAQLPQPASAWHIVGIAHRHAWLTRAMAQAVQLAEWQPHSERTLARLGLSVAAQLQPPLLPLSAWPMLHVLARTFIDAPGLSPLTWRARQDLAAPTLAARASDPQPAAARSPDAPAPADVVPPPSAIIAVDVAECAAETPVTSRSAVQIGNRRLVLAPSGPSPLTGWPHPVRPRHRLHEDDDLPSYPVPPEENTANAAAATPPPWKELPAVAPALNEPAFAPVARPRRRTWVGLVVLAVIASAAGYEVYRLLRAPSVWEWTSPVLSLASETPEPTTVVSPAPAGTGNESQHEAGEEVVASAPATMPANPVMPADGEVVPAESALDGALESLGNAEPSVHEVPSATPANPPIRDGQLFLHSEPAGAQVRLNGVVVGRTPLEIASRPPGTFEALLTLDGYEEVLVGGEILAGETTELLLPLARLDRLAKVHELVERPAATTRVPPDFRRLRSLGSGHVLLSFVIDRSGSPVGVQVEQATDPRLVEPCREALARWQFRPGISHEGRPVNTRVHQLFQIQARR